MFVHSGSAVVAEVLNLTNAVIRGPQATAVACFCTSFSHSNWQKLIDIMNIWLDGHSFCINIHVYAETVSVKPKADQRIETI